LAVIEERTSTQKVIKFLHEEYVRYSKE